MRSLGRLGAMQARAESRMTSRCTIRRIDPDDPRTTGGDGFDGDNWVVVAQDVPCRMAGAARGGTGARRQTVGTVEIEAALRVLHLPASTTGLADGDVVEVTAGDTAGLVARLVDVEWQDQATARRVSAVEIQRPSEWA